MDVVAPIAIVGEVTERECAGDVDDDRHRSARARIVSDA